MLAADDDGAQRGVAIAPSDGASSEAAVVAPASPTLPVEAASAAAPPVAVNVPPAVLLEPAATPEASEVSTATLRPSDEGTVPVEAPPVDALEAIAGDGAADADGLAAPEEKGFLARLGSRVSEMESVQKGVKYVQENERIQKGVQIVKDKAVAIGENERVQKAIEKTKETVTAVKESDRVQKTVAKAKQGYEYASEKVSGIAEGTKGVWSSGRGSVQRVKESVGAMAWKGSARDTLNLAAREEEWKNIKINGAEETTVPARAEHTSVYLVTRGSTLRWTFRVKDYDLGFGVRVRVQEFGGAREDVVLDVERYDGTDTVSGSWVADEDRTIVLVFDNTYSKMRAKTVAYIVGTERPPVYAAAAAIASGAGTSGEAQAASQSASLDAASPDEAATASSAAPVSAPEPVARVPIV